MAQVISEVKPMQDLGGEELFILVLCPKLQAFGVDNPLELKISGRSMRNWLDSAVGEWPNKRVEVASGDDILSLVKKHATYHKYIMVLYGDTPLLKSETISSVLTYAQVFSHNACRLPRGWLFLTEYIKTAAAVDAVRVPDLPEDEFYAVYNFSRLNGAAKLMQNRINEHHMANGVQIIDSATTFIDADVTIERGTIIEPNTVIRGGSSILADCRIGPNAHIRGGTKLASGVRVGNFVEIKNSTLGTGTKVAHLSYIGDATIGSNCNIGCGTVFCNYDGKKKHRTTVGNNVFIGSNANLIAPLKIDDNAKIAAGSTITDDVPTGALAIARERQTTKPQRASAGDMAIPKEDFLEKQAPVFEVIEEADEETPPSLISQEVNKARGKTKGEQIILTIPEPEPEPDLEPVKEEPEGLSLEPTPQGKIIGESIVEVDEEWEVKTQVILKEPDPEPVKAEVAEPEPVSDLPPHATGASPEPEFEPEPEVEEIFEPEEELELEVDEESGELEYKPADDGFDWDAEGDKIQSVYEERD